MKILFNDVINAWLSGTIKRLPNNLRKLKEISICVGIIEKNSKIPYPPIRVVPEVKILYHEYDVTGIVHGNINFIRTGDLIYPIIELSYPFLIYSDRKLKIGVLSHELLHYLFLAKKYIKSDIFGLSQYFGGTVIGHLVFDETYIINPNKIFNDKKIIKLLTEDLEKLLARKGFIKRILKWIESGKPSRHLHSQEFHIKLSYGEFKKLYFPDEVLKVVRRLS